MGRVIYYKSPPIPWSFEEIQDGVQNGRHLNKNISCMFEIAHNKLHFFQCSSVNMGRIIYQKSWIFQEIQDGVQNGRDLNKNISCMLEIAHNKLEFSV